MFVLHDGDRLYLSSWCYNACLIMTELAKIVENEGGRVKPCNTAIISNRSITEAIHNVQDKIDRASTLEPNEKIDAVIADWKAEKEKYEAINNEPIKVTHTLYISFVLNGFYYSYSMDDNPFFPFHEMKTPVRDNKYSQDACFEEADKSWQWDCFFMMGCSKEDIKEAANLIFNHLLKMNPSIIRRDGNRRRVPNTYNGGYHYETVYKPERIAEIDF